MYTDAQFIQQLLDLQDLGPSGLPDMRKALAGQMPRLLALAAKGAGVRPRKAVPVPKPKPEPMAAPAATTSKTKIPEDCPTADQRATAVKYWEEHRRPDLVVTLVQHAESFRAYHISRGTRMESWRAAWQTWYTNQLSHTKPPRGADLLVAHAQAYEGATSQGWIDRLEVFFFGGRGIEAGFWLPKYGPKPGDEGCRAPASLVKVAREQAARREAG